MTITLRAGVLNSGIQQNGTEFLTVDTSNNATLSNNLTVTGTLSATGAVITSPSISSAVMTTMASSVITSGTAVASTSGTSIDFTGVPSWVKRITVMLSAVSVSGTSSIQIQIGSGSVVTSGYVGSISRGTSYLYLSAGFQVGGGVAAQTYSGIATLCLLGSNVWCESGTMGSNSSDGCYVSGGTAAALSGALGRIRITTVNGTDTFDAGSVNILYE